KTEVAIRAAFKAVMGGKQVAILVPTTVLARQHWLNIRERMSEFPVTVEMLCRLTPKDRERKIVKDLKDGTLDIVVGTHRVISKDIQFKDLGLVVIDEEQRFGVKHKERFKELFRLVDVLTLSATPIPRTLYLALMGMRDMSTIETPPPNKQAVQTLICPYDERIIKQAIDAELDRGGQVFFLHNRVMTIERIAQRIRELCPRARIAVGHGQMDGELLEDVMHTFMDGRADVLVCTTIIESGVDIPNANTIIIDRADRFGLADLYQLRGRVGRGGTQAHAYLLLPRDAVTAGDARKRVNAIKQYAGLGSGFKIALRDLEIRGAGNLLGTEQSGHIAAVGFDMYCQMLKQAVNKMQGRRVSRPIEVALCADFLVQSEALMLQAAEVATPAFLPSTFVEDTRLRITAYRQLGEVMTRKELDELETQWRDQFGDKLPHAVQNLLTCASIRLAASHAGVTDVEIKERKLMLTRNGKFVMLNGKFPRLTERQGYKQLQEALVMLRSL
ncbi:MAG: TRCF domain-containing protein, partial [Prosthecobacter sp.]|nr:TRCF domain-containing protein [Prosthecobacter sp.]